MVTPRSWTPDRGDLIWLTFAPQAGREQAGRRPALVLSPAMYNRKTSLAVVCPITSQVKGYPFEVNLPEDGPIGGCVLADHLKNIDWQARHARLIGRAHPDTLSRVLHRLAALLGFE